MGTHQLRRAAITFISSCLIGMTGHACAGQGESLGALPASIGAQLRKMPQEVRLLKMADMDLSSCGTLGSNPGLVTGDFNGDGLPDYAALLISKVPKREQVWEGKKLSLVDAWFAIFLQKGDGTFDRKDIEHMKTFLPSGMGLDMQPAGSVKESESGQAINLKLPAVEWYFCEKGASVYYWDGKSFSSISISD